MTSPFDDSNSVVIVDADVAVHQVSRAAEHQVRWPNGVWTWFADEDDAILILDNYINKIKRKTFCSEVVLALSSDTNFRHGVYPEYKFSRNNEEAYGPLLKTFLHEYMSKEFDTIKIDGLEADDVIGILMTTPTYKKDKRKVLATIDKDLDTIPGEHYNITKEDLYMVDETYADHFFYQQCLTGDRVDDIPGCPGFGPKTAQKLLDSTEPELWWPEIIKAYNKKGLTEDDALITARLVRILRNTEWIDKKVKLWEPTVI